MDAIQRAVARERRVETSDGARVAMPIGRGYLGGAPLARIDDALPREVGRVSIRADPHAIEAGERRQVTAEHRVSLLSVRAGLGGNHVGATCVELGAEADAA